MEVTRGQSKEAHRSRVSNAPKADLSAFPASRYPCPIVHEPRNSIIGSCPIPRESGRTLDREVKLAGRKASIAATRSLGVAEGQCVSNGWVDDRSGAIAPVDKMAISLKPKRRKDG